MRTVAVAATALCALTTSCGDGGDQPPTARAALGGALVAFERGEVDELCSSLSKHAKEVIGLAMHASAPFECEHDVRPFLRLIGRYRGGPTITGLERTGPTRAVATLRLPDGAPVTLPLSRAAGGWRLDGLFDASVSRIQGRNTPQEASKALKRRPGRVAVAGVTVRDRTRPGGPPCPPIETTRFPELRGGCLVELQPENVRLSLRTPFGAMRFAECELSYFLRIDGEGRAWVEGLVIGGGPPCFDALPCWDRKQRMVPWRGRIARADGAFVLSVEDACLDTCVGRFEGEWRVAMIERPRSWRLQPQSMIGTSGWSFDGGVATDGKPVAVE